MTKKLKIAAIRPATLLNKLTTTVSPSLPIGLAYILGAIKDLNVDIMAIDAFGESPLINKAKKFSDRNIIVGIDNAEIITRLDKFIPDVVLITCMFSSDWLLIRYLINEIKNKYPNCIIIGGGEHFTALSEFCFQDSAIDCIVTGEGEDTIREIIIKMLSNDYGNDPIKGALIKSKDKILKGEERKRIRNLEKMPWPAWEFFNVDIMLDNGIGNTSFGVDNFRPMTLNATRGCPYECSFCSNPQMWGKLWRARPVEDIIKEMKFLINRYKANHFDFTDLTLAVKKPWLKEFCETMIKEKLSVTWGVPSGTRVEVLDYEMLNLLKEAGLNDITYAPESGSPRMLKIIKKKINPKQFIRSLKDAVKIQLRTRVNIIIGFPDETRYNYLETLLFVCKTAYIGVNDLLVMGLSIYPGTEDFKRVEQDRGVKLDDEYFDMLTEQGSLGFAPCYSNHYTRLELNIYKYLIWIAFYSISLICRPNRILKLVRDLFKQQGSTRLSMGLINLAKRFRASIRT
jgi:anaerobic magnesium-protoporphyrin IX monomethyl ester cyclase